MSLDVEPLADAIETRLREVGTPERATQERRYLKSDLTFLGATMGQISVVVREVGRTHRSMSHDELVRLVERLWSVPVHERRMAAACLLERFVDLLGPADLSLVERLIRESKTWALVDVLAGDVAGRLVAREPDSTLATIQAWAADDDFWVRRSSLLAELRPIREGGSLDRFLRHADTMLDEREFFIRKAIGWVLREAGKRHPDQVTAWLAPRTHRSSGVTVREAVKYLPEADAGRLMAAYREKRPATAQ